MINEKQRLIQIENQIKQLQKELDEIKKQFKKGPRLIFQTTMKEAQYMSFKNLIMTDIICRPVQNAVNRKSSNVLPEIQTIDVAGPSSSNTEATNIKQFNTEATNIEQFNTEATNIEQFNTEATNIEQFNTEATNIKQFNTEATNIKQFNTEATNTFNELLNDAPPFNLESNQPQWFNEPLSETGPFTPF